MAEMERMAAGAFTEAARDARDALGARARNAVDPMDRALAALAAAYCDNYSRSEGIAAGFAERADAVAAGKGLSGAVVRKGLVEAIEEAALAHAQADIELTWDDFDERALTDIDHGLARALDRADGERSLFDHAWYADVDTFRDVMSEDFGVRPSLEDAWLLLEEREADELGYLALDLDNALLPEGGGVATWGEGPSARPADLHEHVGEILLEGLVERVWDDDGALMVSHFSPDGNRTVELRFLDRDAAAAFGSALESGDMAGAEAVFRAAGPARMLEQLRSGGTTPGLDELEAQCAVAAREGGIEAREVAR